MTARPPRQLSLWPSLVVAAAIMMSSEAPAAETGPPEQRPVVNIRIHPGVRDEAITYIAEIGEPTLVLVSEPTNILNFVSAKCGTVRAAYMATLYKLNEALAGETTAGTGSTLVLPACGWYELAPKLTVDAKTEVRALLLRETGFYGPKTHRSFYRRNASLRRATDIPAGSTVVLPYRNLAVSVSLRPGVDAMTAQKRLKVSLRETPEIPISPSSRGAIVELAQGTPQEAASCRTEPASRPWPFDGSRLVKALNRSVEIARQAGRLNSDVRVAVLDTGLTGPPTDVFRWERLVVTRSQIGLDEFGSDAVAGLGTPLPDPDIEDPDHGTMVATLALGGTSFLKADTERLSRLRLRIERIAQSSALDTSKPPRMPEVLEQSVVAGLRDAMDHDVFIANISFQFPSKLALVRSTLAEHEKLLLVVAAGNDGPDEGDIGLSPRYPQNLGGQSGIFRNQVVTVAASDAHDNLASFSAYSADFVDLLAPGCAVPTVDMVGQERLADGTSYAAPLVTFVAGLLKQHGVDRSADLKQRLVISTDVHDELYWSAWSAGILNPFKALELYQDAVWLTGKDEPVRGDLHLDFIHPPTCSSGEEYDLADIRKLARLDGSPDWLLIWQLPEGALKRCRATVSDQEISITVDGSPRLLQMTEVSDIIVRFFQN